MCVCVCVCTAGVSREGTGHLNRGKGQSWSKRKGCHRRLLTLKPAALSVPTLSSAVTAETLFGTETLFLSFLLGLPFTQILRGIYSLQGGQNTESR